MFCILYNLSRTIPNKFKSIISVSRLSQMNNINLIQKRNPLSKIMEWKVVEETYDYHSEIATSCYGDMLHDDERNKKFGAALKKAIEKVHGRGEKAHVLDIGTGTGLLAMLAASYGADSVVACEMFRPMANCAARIIEKNGFAEKIKLIYKHSTSLTVGPGCDMLCRANVLVSEVFDTELIGEGALQTFNHAHEFLLEDNCIVIPSVGTVYVQVIQSEKVRQWHEVWSWKLNEESVVDVPDDVKNCPGAPSVHDVQLSQLPQDEFVPLSTPCAIFKFDFMRQKVIAKDNNSSTLTKAINSGTADAVFMWWDLIMDDEGDILLSCAPVWHHPDASKKLPAGNPALNIPWRDHWMQAIYSLQKKSKFTEGEEINIHGWHDECSLWFAVGEADAIEPPACHCGVHVFCSRTRIGALNDPNRRATYNSALRSIPANKIAVTIGDFSLLGLAAAKLGARRVFILNVTPCEAVRRSCNEFIRSNQLEGIVTLHSSLENIVEEIAEMKKESKDVWDEICILGEPFFNVSLLTWEHCNFWLMKEKFLDIIKDMTPRENVMVFVKSITLKGCCVRFDDLWKIKRPLEHCMGLDMTLFDELINESKNESQITPEPQPLWEYPCRAQSEIKILLNIDMTKPLPASPMLNSTYFSIEAASRVDGISVWAEYELWNGEVICTGARSDPKIDEYIEWYRFERQGIHLYLQPQMPTEKPSLPCLVEFEPSYGTFSFQFPE